MLERTVVIGSSVGLHARPAALFTRAAAAQPVAVTIAKPGQAPVDARSILSIMGLDVKGGQEVILRAEGEGASEALDALVEILAINHDS